jgi:eukaryotic-like serine/threonine-protein kinase
MIDADTIPATPAARSSSVETAGLIEIAVPRLRHLAIILAVLAAGTACIVVLILLGVMTPRVTATNVLEPMAVALKANAGFVLVVLGVAFGASLAMIALVRQRECPPRRVLRAGVLFQVFGALCLALVEELSVRPWGALSLICIWILAFALVPQRTSRAAVAGIGAALAGPVAIAVNVALGHRGWPEPSHAILNLTGTLACAGLAVFINRVVYSLGRQVVDAKRLGAYVLVEKLGEGGMGEVWRAEHRTLIRPAAVKLLRRESTDRLPRAHVEAMNLRFQREVQATALLTSPHTIAVYDFGTTGDSSLYYVMELLHGLDAERLVEQHGPLPAERVIHLLRQACESLSEAHASDLVHRDIKPANLYLCAIGRELDFVKVLDFGLVRDLTSDIRLTGAGDVAGTPAYMAPETAIANRVDVRSDLYALGCVAYWMLTGRLVFEAETAAAMMTAHIRDDPAPPSRRTELAIPPELDALVLACLAKDPAARPQTADELRDRLAAIPLAAAWTQARARAWWDAHEPDVLHSRRDELAALGTPTRLRRGTAPLRAVKAGGAAPAPPRPSPTSRRSSG